MSVATLEPTAAGRFAVPPEPVLPLTVGQYHAMIRAGELESGATIELLEGWLVTKMTKSPPHSAATAKTRRRLNEILPDGWSVDAQEPVTTADSEPEPDVAVIRGLREDYVERHPGPEDVGLLVEKSRLPVPPPPTRRKAFGSSRNRCQSSRLQPTPCRPPV